MLYGSYLDKHKGKFQVFCLERENCLKHLEKLFDPFRLYEACCQKHPQVLPS